ncbi:helix-turn-helix domain-containing protein [Oceanobacillus jeddahense]|uniref:helix-turn-helix domain-containing protein n=1 Tax=Oceanobacillus jeddahense TaxID=1462527 RepID=UPI000595BA28|nr:helix-turn-helix transcriptional regulator [Oceanobacillus jeddahense]
MQVSEGELLRRMRAIAGFTQTKMAKLMNCDKSLISRLESGAVSVTLKRAMVWADKTGNQDMLIAFVAGSQVVAETLVHTSGILGFASMLFINLF